MKNKATVSQKNTGKNSLMSFLEMGNVEIKPEAMMKIKTSEGSWKSKFLDCMRRKTAMRKKARKRNRN